MTPAGAGDFARNTQRLLTAGGLFLAAACARPVTAPQPVAIPVPVAENSNPPGNQAGNDVFQQGQSVRAESAETVRFVEPTRGIEADATAAAPEVPSWDIDVHSYAGTDRVAHYVTRFSGPSRSYIASRLSRGTRYEAMIRSTLREQGIPEDMYYLALVESGFDPNAYSRAAAVGMWQFMSSTARGMGLRVDWWVDERRDPVLSTRAAAKFLGGLREQFGSIYLAAAAYNGGPGRVARGLSRYADDLDGTEGDDLFFALAGKDYLRTETRDYVPQLIAVALIGKEPGRYGIEVKPQPAYAYDSVMAPAMTTLAAIAGASGVPLATVREMNAHILRGMAPPKGSAVVRLPVGSAAGLDSILDAMPDSARVGARVVRTKGTETAEKLGKLTGVTAKQVAAFNTGLRKSKKGLYLAGQTVYVPTLDAVAGASSVPDPGIEIYGSGPTSGTHIVKKGETLSGIAKKYRTTTAALQKVNGLKKSIIFPGQEILVSGSNGPRSSARKPPAAAPAKKPVSSAKKPAAKSTAPASSAKKPAAKSTAPASSAKKPAAKSTAPASSAKMPAAKSTAPASSAKKTATKTATKQAPTSKKPSAPKD